MQRAFPKEKAFELVLESEAFSSLANSQQYLRLVPSSTHVHVVTEKIQIRFKVTI